MAKSAKKRVLNKTGNFHVESLEPRLVLTSFIFPAFVNGQFEFGDPSQDAPYGLENTFALESIPGADKTIYLDFDGHHSVNNSWGHNIQFPAFNRNGSPNDFSNSELVEIQKTWQNVAEDFLPFNVNVTTTDPGIAALTRTGGNDSTYGVRAVATQATNGFGNGIGGVAITNSFNDSVDNPVFAFNKGTTNGGMTISHEVGHSLGLAHDGLGNQTYHPGTGSGATGWGPIMGAPFGKNLTQWSNGDYVGATSQQNDLAIIANIINGFGYRGDDFGNGIGNAAILDPSEPLFEWGIIERNTDVDFFEFTTAGGNVVLDIRPFGEDPNLDILARLYNSAGEEIASDNGVSVLRAGFDQSLAAGSYFVSVEGTGRDPRYSDYGSLGFYTIEGNIPASTIDGDFDDNGVLDGVDIDLLVANIAIGPADPGVFDLTGDGNVDLDDRDAWLAEAGATNLASGNSYLLGDANLDGTVDGQDFTAWNANKFTDIAAWTAGDFTANGTVDGQDFTEWNAHKFTSADSIGGNSRVEAGIVGELDDAPFWPLSDDAFYHDNHDEFPRHEREAIFADGAVANLDQLNSHSHSRSDIKGLPTNSQNKSGANHLNTTARPYGRSEFAEQNHSQRRQGVEQHQDSDDWIAAADEIFGAIA